MSSDLDSHLDPEPTATVGEVQTPQRRSMADLNEIFSSLPGGQYNEYGQPVAPLYQLPQLIASYEARRGIQLFSWEEQQALVAFAEGKHELVGLDQLLGMLSLLGGSSGASPSPHGNSAAAGSGRSSGGPTTPTRRIRHPDPDNDDSNNHLLSSPTFNTNEGTSMLSSSTYFPADGSPRPPLNPRARTTSNSSFTSTTSSHSASSLSSSTSQPTSSSSSPNKLNLPRSKSMFSGIHYSPTKASRSSSNAEGGVGRRELGAAGGGGGEDSVSDAVVSSGGTYLGVALDGPVGQGWDPEAKAVTVREATKTLGKANEKDLIDILGTATFPQIRSVDKAYHRKYGKDLLNRIATEGKIRGIVQWTFKGLIMGPLNWDVELLKKALNNNKAESNPSINYPLLIDLLVGRNPSDVHVLSEAYARRFSLPSTNSSTLKPKHSHKALLDALLASHPGSGVNGGNVKMRLAWETVLEAKWRDLDSHGDVERKVGLVGQDVDQLKVALRKNGNVDFAIKILLARSPAHIHALCLEFRKKVHASLTHTIKEHVSPGPLRDMLLYAVETGKNGSDGPGVWRDAKLIKKTMEGIGTRNEALSWKLVRAHWDRPRFKLVQESFEKKYGKTLLSTVLNDTTSHHRDLLKAIITTADLPEPEATFDDIQRLDVLAPRSRGSSVCSVPETLIGSADEEEHGVLEGSGELAEDKDESSESEETTPVLPTTAQFGDRLPPSREEEDAFVEDRPLSKSWSVSSSSMSASQSLPNLGASISSTSSTDSIPFVPGHRSSSSLSARQRSSPLEGLGGHRPPSSAGGSQSRVFDKPSSARHSRPAAPGRIRRSSEDYMAARANSEEPSSPTPWGAMSPGSGGTPGSERALSPIDSQSSSNPRSGSRIPISRRQSSVSSLSSHSGLASTSPQTSTAFTSNVGSPPASIDTKSYYATPISPVGDVGPSASPFNPHASPSPYSFDDVPLMTGQPFADFFSGNDSSPDKAGSTFLRRQGSTASNGSAGSRPTSLFFGEAFGAAGGFRPDSMGSNFGRAGSAAAAGPEAVQYLLKQLQDMSKKLKDSEVRFESTATAFEQEQSELESRLDEARSELQIKKREEKDLRAAEKQHLSQIASLEGEIAKLAKSLERSREQYESMKRNYQDQCTEAEKLRTLVAETRRENKAAEDAAQQHNIQVHQFERDTEILQSAIAKLEADLAVARQAQESLDDQKQENLVLKETIDRLRFDMDELRTAGRKSLFLDGTGSSTSLDRAGSVPASMSKSLGQEIARRLAQTQQAEEEDEEVEEGEDSEADEEKEVDDIVVTTHRIKKRIVRKTGAASVVPTITHVEQTTHVADAETQTVPTAMAEMDVQTDLSAVLVEVIEPAPVESMAAAVVEELNPRQKREALAQELHIDLTQLEDMIAKGRSASRIPVELAAPSPRRHVRFASRLSSRFNAAAQAPAFFVSAIPESARPFVGPFVESSTTFVLYTMCTYLFGFISGSYLFPITHHHHVATPFHILVSGGDRANWHQYNNFGSHWGEGLGAAVAPATGLRGSFLHWMNELVWGSVAVVRRVPV